MNICYLLKGRQKNKMIDYDNKIVGSQVRKYRQEKGLSIRQLAEKINISQSYLSDIENGGKTEGSSVSMKIICKIAEVLGVSINDLASTNLEYMTPDTNSSLVNEYIHAISSLDINYLNILKNAIEIFNDEKPKHSSKK